jgi:outer membrane protein OmpA-like peptidoglycan-associated protein
MLAVEASLKGMRMRRLINTTTILSVALYMVPPFAAQAQDLQKVTVGDKEVICLPNKKTPCPDGAMCVVAKKPENCQANAEKAVAAAKDPAAAAQAETDQATADKAAADKAAADKAAADQAAADQAAADKAAAEQTAADKAAADKAAADQAAADKAAADQAAADKAAADKAAADKAAADKAAADKAAADQTAADKAAVDKAAADQAAADKAAADQAAADQAAADKAATDQATTDKATRKAAKAAKEKAAADQAAADKAAADKAASDQAAADKAIVDQTAKDQAAADKAASDKAAADQKAADQAATDQAAADKAAADKLAADQAAADKAAADKAATDKAASDQAATDKAAADQAAADKATADKVTAEQAAQDAAAIAAAKKAQQEAEAKAAADPNLKPVQAPLANDKAVKTLATVLAATAAGAAVAGAAAPLAPVAAAAADPVDLTKAPSPDQPAPKDAVVTTETVSKQDVRTSAQDFSAAPVAVAPGKKSGLSDLEKVGLVALGALVIGSMINNNKQEVVSNTGDRVVVRQDDGTYHVYKDDNSLLRQPGSKVTTQTFQDGSTRTIVVREDGTKISTIRDASGRVLQRVSYDLKGRPTVLIDDMVPEQRVDVTTLPAPRPQQTVIHMDDNEAAMKAALAAADAQDLGRKFSLRQIRTIAQVRYLAPTINVTSLTFQTGSAAIQPDQAQSLNKLGRFIRDLIARNPGEVFLIEGHTDAVGSAASNLSLSDRRAESVAKALTEYFQVPPENLVVQGYGESELLVNSGGDEQANRRVAVRIITPLLQQTAAAN